MATIMGEPTGQESANKAGEQYSSGYIMALDAGTTSVRAVLFDEYG